MRTWIFVQISLSWARAASRVRAWIENRRVVAMIDVSSDRKSVALSLLQRRVMRLMSYAYADEYVCP